MNKQDEFSIVFSKRRLQFRDVFRNSVTKPHNICTTQAVRPIIFEFLFPNFVYVAPSKIA